MADAALSELVTQTLEIQTAQSRCDLHTLGPKVGILSIHLEDYKKSVFAKVQIPNPSPGAAPFGAV